MKKVPRVVLMVYALGLMVGCTSVQQDVTDISCRYQFRDIDREEDQKRVEKAVRSVAKGEVVKTGKNTDPKYQFTVAKLKDLGRIHPRILYKNPTAQKPSELRQTLNARNPRFDITYDSTDISASMDIIITFSVKPSSQLFYKDQGGSEIDITSRVDRYGEIILKTKIKKGQEFIFARTVLDNVIRYIKINIYNQIVTDIDQTVYDSSGLSEVPFFENFLKNLNMQFLK
ncbi:MAG: hypothetical protein JJV91_02060 [Desulfosarcina sp.]|nr:hypothetical protein [Desulfobacterales bacterium]